VYGFDGFDSATVYGPNDNIVRSFNGTAICDVVELSVREERMRIDCLFYSNAYAIFIGLLTL
jgi:hypothetical protein